MWDEEINKKIKDSADQYHPAYDDTAWEKMEKMLDKHLPQKKERRRIIYFLPPVLLLGVLSFIFFRKEPTSSLKISEKTLQKDNLEKSPDKRAGFSSAGVKADPGPVKSGNDLSGNKIKETPVTDADPGNKKIDRPASLGSAGIAQGNTRQASENLPHGNKEKQSGYSPLTEVNVKSNSGIKNSTDEIIHQPLKPQPAEEVVPGAVADNNSPLKTVNTSITGNEKEIIKPKDVKKGENPKAASKKDVNSTVKQNKTKESFIQHFGLGLSIGPDVSATKLSHAGKITFTYGAELNYSFNNKFTLRTGFYVATKIYSVGKEEYHVPPGSTWSNYLESVDANCKVYEVPITLSYNFGKTKNHSWFASAGLSSYFMKKESYIYYYKNPSGVTWDNPWAVTNKNKHYFSVLDISGGYKYSVSNRFSVIAEPYVKLPLSGIGIGKIKLNSAGVLFTAAIKPF